MYCHGLTTPRTQQKFRAPGSAGHSVVSRYRYQAVQNSGQKEDGYATVVATRATGNMDEVMGRTLDRSELGVHQKVLRKVQRFACSSRFRLAGSSCPC